MDEKKENRLSTVYKNLYTTKSNIMISALCPKINITGLKIMYAAMVQLRKGEYEHKNDRLIVRMNRRDIARYLGTNSHSFYNKLLKGAISMMGRVICFERSDEQGFMLLDMIPKAQYDSISGEFRIEFADELEEPLVSYTSNYTYLPANVMMAFNSEYGFRLYELLKKECYYGKGHTGIKDHVFQIYFGINELRFLLGTSNIDNPGVQEYIANHPHLDYDEMDKRLKPGEKKYLQWRDFQKKCITTAIDEIHKADPNMKVSYALDRSGRGGKARGIHFTVSLMNHMAIEDQKDNASGKPQFFDSIAQLLPEIPSSDYQVLAETASWDLDRIKTAKEVLDSYPKSVDNITGFLLVAMKKNFQTVKRNQKNSNSSFCNFPQREYDFAKLEKELLKEEIK